VALGAEFLAVSILDEACQLRGAGITDVPILVLGYTPPVQAGAVVGNRLSQTIYNMEQAQALSAAAGRAGLKARVHIKVDTGMSRLGVPPSEAASFAKAVSALPSVEIEGLFTHFAAADSGDKTFALKQLAEFNAARGAIENSGLKIPIQHCANSAATLELPQSHLNMVRVGIAMYGLAPSPETRAPFELREAMRLKTRLALLKTVPTGTPVSYGGTFVTQRLSQIATLPIGYADGWSRLLGGRAEISLKGRRAPLVGRVCMDQCMADVTDIPNLSEGDEALLFGAPDISINEIAATLGTINYEVVCMIGKRVPRVYLNAAPSCSILGEN
jgi:alanine racemase